MQIQYRPELNRRKTIAKDNKAQFDLLITLGSEGLGRAARAARRHAPPAARDARRPRRPQPAPPAACRLRRPPNKKTLAARDPHASSGWSLHKSAEIFQCASRSIATTW
jgi:hypothetical protein